MEVAGVQWNGEKSRFGIRTFRHAYYQTMIPRILIPDISSAKLSKQRRLSRGHHSTDAYRWASSPSGTVSSSQSLIRSWTLTQHRSNLTHFRPISGPPSREGPLRGPSFDRWAYSPSGTVSSLHSLIHSWTLTQHRSNLIHSRPISGPPSREGPLRGPSFDRWAYFTSGTVPSPQTPKQSWTFQQHGSNLTHFRPISGPPSREGPLRGPSFDRWAYFPSGTVSSLHSLIHSWTLTQHGSNLTHSRPISGPPSREGPLRGPSFDRWAYFTSGTVSSFHSLIHSWTLTQHRSNLIHSRPI